ncbi:MAG: phosphopyruvate hydratase [Myxococcota bacterium]
MNELEIVGVTGRRLWDSRGRPALEVEIQLRGGAAGRAIAPAGASTGSGEAVDLRDGGPRFGGQDVRRALSAVNVEIRQELLGADAGDQRAIDKSLIRLDGSPDKHRLGGNSLIATSMAVAHAAAAAHRQPLWRFLGGDEHARLPLPEIQIFGGGAHAARTVDVQDYLVCPVGAADFATALDWSARVYQAAGEILEEAGRLRGVADEGGHWPAFEDNEQGVEMLLRAIERADLTPGEDVAISLDVAASEFWRDGRYLLAAEGRTLDSDGLCELMLGWIDAYPIAMVEDPFAEDDREGFIRFTRAVGDRVQVIGDDYLVTRAERVAAAAADRACNAVLIKPNQAGTLSETRDALDAARKAGWGAIASARSGESEDTTIVHLAVGWGVTQLKVGSIARGERTAKWNEGLRIAEALGGPGRLPGAETFPWGRRPA